MAPTKKTSTTSNRSVAKNAAAALASLLPVARKNSLRGRAVQDQNVEMPTAGGKRKATDYSPVKNERAKRSALGNLTNNVNKLTILTTNTTEDAKQKQQHIGKKAHTTVLKETHNASVVSGSVADLKVQPNKITTRAAAAAKGAKNDFVSHGNKKSPVVANKKSVFKMDIAQTAEKAQSLPLLPPPAPVAAHQAHSLMPIKVANKQTRRISNEFNQTEDSLYMSALEDVSSSESMRLSNNFEAVKRRVSLLSQHQQQQQDKNKKKTDDSRKSDMNIKAEEDADDDEDDGRYKDFLSKIFEPVPSGVDDFDKATWNDPFQVSNYATDIFNYLKSREPNFIIDNYMERQVNLSKWMRSLLVDWMVEVQETFELNHETLYLAVKIVDLYLCRVVILKERLQLLGAAALFIACKYDERTPPLIEDFLYICDGAYKHEELVKMEMLVLRTIDYDLGIPLSYRFLRRYARCAKIQMPTLTLARYALELSLMDYDTIHLSDSRLACAALYIALRLHGEKKPWSPALEYYTGYKLIDFADIVPLLLLGMHRKPKGTIKNIRNKYSHKIFHEVAKVKLMSIEQLFEHELDINLSPKSIGDDSSR